MQPFSEAAPPFLGEEMRNIIKDSLSRQIHVQKVWQFWIVGQLQSFKLRAFYRQNISLTVKREGFCKHGKLTRNKN